MQMGTVGKQVEARLTKHPMRRYGSRVGGEVLDGLPGRLRFPSPIEQSRAYLELARNATPNLASLAL